MKFYWIINEIRNIKRKNFRDIETSVGKERIHKAFEGFTIRERIYYTWPLFQIFLNQAASGISCGEAIVWGISQKLLPLGTSPKTSAYCNAKSRLPEKPIFDLMKSVGVEVEAHTHRNHKIFGRNVKVVDGTSVQLPDTASNQRAYPQPDGQKPGCGQPHMKLCALMGLGTGAIIDCAVDAYRVSERTMFRTLWRSLEEGDIVLGDRGFGSYAEVALILKMGVDFVFRQKLGSLKTKAIRKIRKDEWIVTWKRPQEPGDWVGPDQLPDQAEIRAIRFRTEIKGFRSEEIILFTSLTDPKQFPREKLIELYYRRWEMELRIRDIKTTMGMDFLKPKTPSGCRKELWMALLAYNMALGNHARCGSEREIAGFEN
jgi:IS4 transposase